MLEVIDEYLETLKRRGYAAGTIGHMEHTLNQFAAFLISKNLHALRDTHASHVRAFQETFVNYSEETKAHKTSNLRTFLKYAHMHKHMREDLSQVLKSIRRRRSLKSVLTREDVAAFMLLPDTETGVGVRDRAILELLYSSGLRREEVVRLELYDIDWSEGTIKVIGKGDKQRIIPVGKVALFWIHRYVKEFRGSGSSKNLFLQAQSTRGALKNNGIGVLFKRYAPRFRKESSFKGRLSPHALRHAAATHLLQNGASSRVVQEFLGHAQLVTTQIYTHVLTGDLRGVVDRYHPRPHLKTD